MTTLPYGGGKVLDIYRPEDGVGLPVVLLWHGSGPDERDALATLASRVAKRGAVCLVPDWQSDMDDIGRENLLTSISFAREDAQSVGGDRSRISLCGWSWGANAAADVTLHPDVTAGWRPSSFVGLAGGYDVSPITGGPIVDGMTHAADVPCLFIHGIQDQIVSVEHSRRSHETLYKSGWQSKLREVDTDHAGILGTRYDSDLARCVPSSESDRVLAVNLVAEWLFEHVDT